MKRKQFRNGSRNRPRSNNYSSRNATNPKRDEIDWGRILSLVGGFLAVCNGVIKIVTTIKKGNTDSERKNKFEEKKHSNKMAEEELKHQHKMEQIKRRQQDRADGATAKWQNIGKRWQPSTIPIPEPGKESIWEKEPRPLDMILNDPPSTPNYFVDTPIMEGDIVLMVSGTGYGKSLTLTQMLFNIARGAGSRLLSPSVEYAKYKVQPTPILYDSEMTTNDLIQRYGNYEPPFLPILQKNDFADHKELLSHIEEQVCGLMTDCVIAIDNVTNVTNCELHANQVNDFFRGLRMIQKFGNENGFSVTFIIVRHTTKNAKGTGTNVISGSDHWARLATKIISLNPVKGDDDLRLLHIEKNRTGKSKQDMYVSFCKEPYPHFVCNEELNVEKFGKASPFVLGSGNQEECFCNSPSCVYGVLQLHKSGKSLQEIADTYGVSKMTIKRVVDNHAQV